ncbi:MAG TPA: DUF885 domain-containing protein [Candidatus Obscuribacterales bacterium]
MRLPLRVVVPAVLCALTIVCPVQAAKETPYEKMMAGIAASAGKKSERDRLWEIFKLDWRHQMDEYPEWATSVGEPGRNGRWTDDSMESIKRRKRELDAPLKALKSIDRSQLDEQDRLNYDIFKYSLDVAVEGRRFPGELLPVCQLEGVQQTAALTLVQNPNATVRDYEDILSRLRGIPVVIEQTLALMNEGLKKNITPPRITLRDVPRQIKSQIVEYPEKSPLFEPFKNFPATISSAEQARLRAAAVSTIRDSVVPSYKKMLDFFVSQYEPKCRDSISLADLPEGKQWYAHKVKSSTTLNLTPEEIHEIGLSEVKRIRSEMEALAAKSGFQGSFQEFLQYLRTDKRFFYDNADDLLIGYRDIAKRIDPELIKQFGKLPRLQYGIEPVPAFSEKAQPTAYYRSGNLNPGRAGVFFANTYDLKSRPKWEMEPLTLHEAVPGHHLQISLAQEMESLPDFRKHGGFTAYVEGWGLYAESLGSELGMYKDTYSKFGQLSFDMWRSIRLVLDTGIHAKGWTRQQAIDFFKENSSKPIHDIEVEVDRYIVWPGQALAYKLGQLRIKELKQKARAELGDKFDVRAFHDHVLGMGAVPLSVLSEQTQEWIDKSRKLAASNRYVSN